MGTPGRWRTPFAIDATGAAWVSSAAAPFAREPDGPTHTTTGTAERRIARTSSCTFTSTAPLDASWITNTSARRSFAPRIESRMSSRVRWIDQPVDLRDLDPVLLTRARATVVRSGRDVGTTEAAEAAEREQCAEREQDDESGCGEIGGTGVGGAMGLP